MTKEHISVRVASEMLKEVDRRVFARRLQRASGRAATRSAVINDLLAAALNPAACTTSKE